MFSMFACNLDRVVKKEEMTFAGSTEAQAANVCVVIHIVL